MIEAIMMDAVVLDKVMVVLSVMYKMLPYIIIAVGIGVWVVWAGDAETASGRRATYKGRDVSSRKD